ncbi:MAG: hypothetical protein R3F65_30065 [bacterium]
MLTFDGSVEAAWDEKARAVYQLTGRAPDSGLPREATRFVIRPMGWAERRAARDATASGLYTARGSELREAFIHAVRKGALAAKEAGDADVDGAADRAGDVYRRSLSMDDRAELDRSNALVLDHDEVVVERCVVEVREGGRRLSWTELRELLAPSGLVTRAIQQLAVHITRISSLEAQQGE